MTYYTTVDSPIGELLLTSEDGALSGVRMAPFEPGVEWWRDDKRFADVVAQLGEYFAGHRQTFDVVLDPNGTPFQRKVWQSLLGIPYGETASYGEVARRIGNARAVRAVGRANGANPIAVIIPCHRVIGSNGTLTGYGGGIDRKSKLLDLEARYSRTGKLDERL